MLFKYTAIDQSGKQTTGSIDAVTEDVAINSLQRRGLVISSISPAGESDSFLEKNITLFEHVSNRDVVILSRQIATLFEAQVSALRVFRLLAGEAEKPLLGRTLAAIADDLQGGSSISKALSRHPAVFSSFYVNMVKAGEESGKLDATFEYLADHLDRTYEVSTKARNALIYPAFVIFTFVAVMILMLTLVVPRLSTILLEAGQEIPFYTRVVIGLSQFFVNFGPFLLILLIAGGFYLWRYGKTEKGSAAFSRFKTSIPYLGDLYRKLYLSRIADNLSTMLSSGIQMVRGLEISASVVGDATYARILTETMEKVQSGVSVSDAFEEYPEMPGIMVAMVRVGEETGELGEILNMLAKFYRREVTNAVDTLVNLIEPIMIVTLGLGVGILLASVLIPIYNISTAI
ncbi:hypothetical protein COU17_02580 [Candidatus Kaiserbacteria bacterium CG10_big_fil_rev_8_21_14_0_10_49_17]|uniref:Type II secretion system protein GspF domain-containing protein n=1 Tax=Candidatus Kaiserbacteria bacterium CG10_big_fil_rev_8_21_14_0_10_49_17 TaxID=1974609 RepID=A0A2M6WE35_9BACT|nr:MAG: hypothetical protein COU17_02580 [Candidatus Kaiserbacteria bacterium CG10_big_fil_rev_8_21_14_0_10_49_17]